MANYTFVLLGPKIATLVCILHNLKYPTTVFKNHNFHNIQQIVQIQVR